MEATIKITLDNAAFEDDGNGGRDELASILRHAADKVSQGADSVRLIDANGNAVGRLEISD